MDYTSIHIYGHLLSDEILRSIEQDNTLLGNREQDYSIDITTSSAIDYAWSSLRNDWHYYNERSIVNDTYGTRRSRDLIERFFQSLGYKLARQQSKIEAGGSSHEITYLCPELGGLPFIVIGENPGGQEEAPKDRCSLDCREKGGRKKKSPHAAMLEYLNSTECVYGIISNGPTVRLLRNSGQLVKLSYIEFDLRRMLDEDKYTEFCLLFRLLHSSRFRQSGDEPCVMERWFNMSIESGNRIRAGLSRAVQTTMEIIGTAAITGEGDGNEALRRELSEGDLTAAKFNRELIHFVYRLLFLFIIEDRNLVYDIPESPSDPNYDKMTRWQDIYKRHYAASRMRHLSELNYLRQGRYGDLWESLMDTFRLFEPDGFGEKIGIKPLGGVLFGKDTLSHLKKCHIGNDAFLRAFDALNEFTDENKNRVKINYSALDVEEFGSVYEGILEMQPFIQQAVSPQEWKFGYVGGLDRQSTSSYYTRPDLVQSLIKTALEPVIKERLSKCTTPEDKVKSLLDMKVCDPASGSGHIVLAMARTIAWYVCTLRTGEDNPASLDYRQALREIISRCVYAVDFNPDAVELCKVVLWIEGYCAGKPLSFLDHHIRCGNSVVGISNLDILLDGVPKEAFKAKDDDKEVKQRIVSLNKKALDEVAAMRASSDQGAMGSFFTQDFTIENIGSEQIGLATQVQAISALPENTLFEQLTKQSQWEKLMETPRVEWLRCACDIYTYSFYKEFTKEDMEAQQDENGNYLAFALPYTRTVYQALQEIKYLDNDTEVSSEQRIPEKLCREAEQAAADNRFFHWAVEFPEVFAYDGGFDVMCGNPPWDKIKVEDKKWFESHNRPDIVNAGTAAQRKEAILQLENTDPVLYKEYTEALVNAESQSRFVRFSHRFKLTATGDIDLYPMFAELCLTFSKEAWGLVLHSGITVNDSNKIFFSKLIDENRLISLYDFENRELLFAIDSRRKFCLLTAGKPQTTPRTVKGGFYLTRIDHLLDPRRIYTLRTDDFARLNPNTKTCPVFRTSHDAELTAKFYRNSSILLNEQSGENPWMIRFGSMFHMSNDSGLFCTYTQLTEKGATLNGNQFTTPDGTLYVPLYEGKMIWLYNHHYGTWPTEGNRPSAINMPKINELTDNYSHITPWYWVPLSKVNERLVKKNKDGEIIWEWKHNWIIGFRDITNATNERTFITTFIPSSVGAGNKLPFIFSDKNLYLCTCLLAMLASLPFDYVTRQKVGGTSMNFHFVKQFPVLTPEQIPTAMQWQIVKRVAELCYFNHDLDGWAEELWEEMNNEQRAELPQIGRQEPWFYDPDRRALLQAELDAIFAHLYGLSTEDLKYILDPEDVCGPGCINETFRVLRDNEMREFGEYRTQRLVLEAWDKFGYDN